MSEDSVLFVVLSVIGIGILVVLGLLAIYAIVDAVAGDLREARAFREWLEKHKNDL